MPLREKFGKLVLLEELNAGALGVVYRAARLSPSGFDRMVTLLRYSEAVSHHAEAPGRLMEQARGGARLQIPGLLRALNIGRVGPSYYAAYELVEGRTIRAVIDRSRTERFPLAADNALTVASRAAAVLEALHAKQDDTGSALFHGLIRPSHVVVSWEGEVRVAGIGIWPALRETGLIGSDERRWLAPEQTAGSVGDARSDIHALALVLLEALTGWSPDGSDPLEAVSTARLPSVTGDEEPLPEPLEELLRRALAPDPSSRYPTMGEMRKAIDTLLFSGDFTPTTFNLAFFMHTLFRDDMESEAKALDEDRRADYTEFLTPHAPPESEARDEPTSDPMSKSEPPAPADAELGPGPSAPSPPAPTETPSGVTLPDSDASDSSSSDRRPRSRGRRHVSLPPSRSARMFAGASKPAGGRRGLALMAGLVLTVAAVGGGSYLYFARSPASATVPPAGTLSPETAAALARVRELEARLAEMEREKAEIEAAALGEPEAPPEEKPPPASPPPTVEPEAAEQAREEARRRAEEDRARRDEQIRLLESELQAAQRRLVAEQGGDATTLDLDTALPAMEAPLPTPEPLPPPVVPGQLVDVDDPDVVRPELLSEGPAVRYPEGARRLRRGSLVMVEALVSEDGSVLETRVVHSSTAGLGFEEAAERKVQGNRYRPATKDGIPVRVRVQVPVRFTP